MHGLHFQPDPTLGSGYGTLWEVFEHQLDESLQQPPHNRITCIERHWVRLRILYLNLLYAWMTTLSTVVVGVLNHPAPEGYGDGGRWRNCALQGASAATACPPLDEVPHWLAPVTAGATTPPQMVGANASDPEGTGNDDGYFFSVAVCRPTHHALCQSLCCVKTGWRADGRMFMHP